MAPIEVIHGISHASYSYVDEIDADARRRPEHTRSRELFRN
jgi:hypothetical protein